MPVVDTTRRAARYNVALILDDMAPKGWMPTDLARAAGLSDMTIGRFLKNEVQTARSAKKIAEALGRSVRRYYIPNQEAVAS